MRAIRLRALVGFYRMTPSGRVRVRPGEIFSASAAEADELLKFGRAELSDDSARVLVLDARPSWVRPTVRGGA